MKTRWQDHVDPTPEDIRDEIFRLLHSLKPGESICPSEAARQFGAKWREHMPVVREVAANMVRDGLLEITQRGQVIDVDEREVESIRGPIRLRLTKR